ncbi:Lrp/AsnC family transcriptional regulator [Mesoterricola sediminis]|uniref:AsnC family transcriptional regulator n=1 Tax=Mesoterricola sediminis TaxID=2927980 RepID=A0AA48GZP5_9BACT|nr:Lrp/AsnC family transcriptional regulator [Mesoterricola sediminis]BDU78580.1 AsnC family transcriptional regulator [Mesoterricola sediminis]
MPKRDLDDMDRRLLAELGADARLTQVTLAARVGLSRSAVQARLRRLEREGVILGYTLRLGVEKRPGIRAYLLVNGSGPSHDRAVKLLEAFPEVRVADSVSGDIDLVLQVEVERLEDLNRLRDDLARMPGVACTRTLLVLAPRFDRR